MTTKRREKRRAAVVEFLARRPMEAHYSAEIAEGIDVSLGRIYPELAVLERDGTLLSDWEATDYPRRRVYWVKGNAGRHG